MEIVPRASFAAVVQGKSATERKLSVIDQTRSTAALAVIASFGGKVGKYAGAAMAAPAAQQIAEQAASSNYQEIADIVGAVRGQNFVVNRAVFHALPALIDGWLMDLSSKKNGGWTVDKKTGINKPTAERAGLMALRALVVDVVQASEQIREQRKAEAEAAKAEAARMAQIELDAQ